MRKLLIILLLLLQVLALPAISFGYHVFELRSEPEFSEGVFPSSVIYQFNFPVKDFIQGSSTAVAARLDAGLAFPTLRQDPDDGSFYAQESHPDHGAFDLDYTTMFGEINLFYSQGFMHKDKPDKDFLTVYAAIDARFEHSYDRLDWMTDSGHTDGLFHYVEDGVKTNRFPGSSWKGAPELKSDRTNTQFSITLSFTVDYLREETTERDGFKFTTWLRYAPEYLNFSSGKSDFIASYSTLQYSKTLLSKENKIWPKDLNWVSLVFDDILTYRVIFGDKVPVYIQGGDIWGDSDVPNLRNVFTNRAQVTLYGPQLYARDLYPDLTFFFDLGLGVGKALNSDSDKSYTEWVSSYGIRAEFVLYNICEVFFEIGCVLNPAFDDDRYVEWRAGFRLGI